MAKKAKKTKEVEAVVAVAEPVQATPEPVVESVEGVEAAAEPEIVPDPLFITLGDETITIQEAYNRNPDQIFQLYPEEIDANEEDNGRAPIKRDLSDLIKSIEQHGVQSPIECRIGLNGRPILNFGFGRRAAVQKINEKRAEDEQMTVPVKIRDGIDAKTAYLRNVHENVDRDNLSPIDMLSVIKNLQGKHGMKQREIGKQLNISESAVSYYKSLESITYKKAIMAIHSGRISYSAAVQMAKLTPEAQIKLADKLLDEDVERSVDEQMEEAAAERGVQKQRTVKAIKNTFEEFAGSPGLDPRVVSIFKALEAFTLNKISEKTLLKKVEEAIASRKGKSAAA